MRITPARDKGGSKPGRENWEQDEGMSRKSESPTMQPLGREKNPAFPDSLPKQQRHTGCFLSSSSSPLRPLQVCFGISDHHTRVCHDSHLSSVSFATNAGLMTMSPEFHTLQ